MVRRCWLRAHGFGGVRMWIRLVHDTAVPPLIELTVFDPGGRTDLTFGRALVAEALLTSEAGTGDVRIYREHEYLAVHYAGEFGDGCLFIDNTEKLQAWLDLTYRACSDAAEASWLADWADRAARELVAP